MLVYSECCKAWDSYVFIHFIGVSQKRHWEWEEEVQKSIDK